MSYSHLVDSELTARPTDVTPNCGVWTAFTLRDPQKRCDKRLRQNIVQAGGCLLSDIVLETSVVFAEIGSLPYSSIAKTVGKGFTTTFLEAGTTRSQLVALGKEKDTPSRPTPIPIKEARAVAEEQHHQTWEIARRPDAAEIIADPVVSGDAPPRESEQKDDLNDRKTESHQDGAALGLTNTLVVIGFTRPLKLADVTELMSTYGRCTKLWMNKIKTHCFVTYNTPEEAAAAERGIAGKIFPEGTGRPLSAESLSESEADMLMVSLKLQDADRKPPIIPPGLEPGNRISLAATRFDPPSTAAAAGPILSQMQPTIGGDSGSLKDNTAPQIATQRPRTDPYANFLQTSCGPKIFYQYSMKSERARQRFQAAQPESKPTPKSPSKPSPPRSPPPNPRPKSPSPHPTAVSRSVTPLVELEFADEGYGEGGDVFLGMGVVDGLFEGVDAGKVNVNEEEEDEEVAELVDFVFGEGDEEVGDGLWVLEATSLAVKGKDCLVVVTQKKVNPNLEPSAISTILEAPNAVTHLFKVTSDIGCLLTGVAADARVLKAKTQTEVAEWQYKFGYEIPVDMLAKRVATILKENYDAKNPLRVSVIMVGRDMKDEPLKYRIDDADCQTANGASTAGAYHVELFEVLDGIEDKERREKMGSEELMELAVDVIVKIGSMRVKGSDISIGVVKEGTRQFDILDEEDVADVLMRVVDYDVEDDEEEDDDKDEDHTPSSPNKIDTSHLQSFFSKFYNSDKLNVSRQEIDDAARTAGVATSQVTRAVSFGAWTRDAIPWLKVWTLLVAAVAGTFISTITAVCDIVGANGRVTTAPIIEVAQYLAKMDQNVDEDQVTAAIDSLDTSPIYAISDILETIHAKVQPNDQPYNPKLPLARPSPKLDDDEESSASEDTSTSGTASTSSDTSSDSGTSSEGSSDSGSESAEEGHDAEEDEEDFAPLPIMWRRAFPGWE